MKNALEPLCCEAEKIAEYIIVKCLKEGKYISNFQLQRILYLIQLECLSWYNEPCFFDDFEAWGFGPVIPEVYYSYCGWGASSILFQNPSDIQDYYIDYEKKDSIDFIVEQTRELPHWELIGIVCRENGAWEKTYKKGKGYFDVITPKLMKIEATENFQKFYLTK